VSESIIVKVQLPNETIEECEIEPSHSPPWRLVFSGAGMKRRLFQADDLFEALRGIRKELERTGCRILCAGARRDVYPSGMSRSMSGGRKAYVNRMGAKPTPTDVVDIFDEAEASFVGSVDEQLEFHRRWMAVETGRGDVETPFREEIDEAKRTPNGWVYRIAGRFGPSDDVPPEAVVGAWRVDAQGDIVGAFVRNQKYDPKRYPV
jgi:hypothetical protein